MIEYDQNEIVARCVAIGAQRATFKDSSATNGATTNATNILKALAGAVLERNTQRNINATHIEKQRNFCNEKTEEKLRSVATELLSKIDTRHPATTSTTPAPAAESKTNPAITCKGCIHFESYHAHGGGAGICKADVMPFGACWWADTVHQCDKYLSSASSEYAHNAGGRYFKFLITRQDGTQFYSCSMPRMTIKEAREQYPDATNIKPVEGEDYADEH